jgi:hypothetical protein
MLLTERRAAILILCHTALLLERSKQMTVFDFADPNWRPFSQEKLDALNVSPNQLWANMTDKAGALVVRKSSQYDEFAMSQAGLKYLLAALQAGKIDDGYVVLIAWNGRKLTVVHTMTSPLCPRKLTRCGVAANRAGRR